MGCDIHCYAEVKINGTWHLYDQPEPGRRYGMFALMAGVRNYAEIKPISEPRGLPADISFVTAFEFERWKPDAHSMSWLTVEEVYAVAKAVRAEDKDCWSPFGRLTWWRYELPDGIEDARLVFWFDN